MLGNRSRPSIPLPKQWPNRVRSGVLHAISLAHFSLTFTRSWAANSWNARLRLKAENDRFKQELALLREEMRIKDAVLSGNSAEPNSGKNRRVRMELKSGEREGSKN